VSIFLALCEDAERIVPNWRLVNNMWNVYVRVDDVDAIYAELQERGAAIDYTIYDARTASGSSASRIPTATTSPSANRSSGRRGSWSR
jgi:hypothetical protein